MFYDKIDFVGFINFSYLVEIMCFDSTNNIKKSSFINIGLNYIRTPTHP